MPNKKSNQPRLPIPANDNDPSQSVALTVIQDDVAPSKSQCKILTNFPDQMPVIDGEIALIEAYLSDLISGIIANDN